VSTDVILKPKRFQRRRYAFARAGTWVLIACGSVVVILDIVIEHSLRSVLQTLGAVAILLSVQLTMMVLQRHRIIVRDGMMSIRIPWRREVVVPLANVSRVLRVRLASRLRARPYRTILVLCAGTSPLAVLAEGNFAKDELASLLHQLPPSEEVDEALGVRAAWRAFKVATPLNAGDIFLTVAANALAYAGIVLLIVDALHR
jgi:hypothetical protein